jgi:hypothetical protein
LKKLEYTVIINPDGTWNKNDRVREEVMKMFHTDGYTTYLTMTFFGADKQRTNDQNAYYWAVVIPMVTAGFILQGNELRIGSHRDYGLVHEMMKERFIPEGDMVFFDRNGTKYGIKEKTTTALDTRAFKKYLKDIKAWTFDCLAVDIPEPNGLVKLPVSNGQTIEMTVEEFLESVKSQENNE